MAMASTVVTDLDVTAPGIVMSAMLEHSRGVAPDSALVSVGDTIDVNETEGYLRGHGTLVVEDDDRSVLVSTVCGVIQRVNKLIMVKPFKCRYSAELGDVVVGRIVRLEARRWAVELGAQQRCSLQLSAVQLPGGMQRRRTADDELNMRQIFQEGDLIVAEVQQIGHDRSIALHMRSSKYCRLRKGQYVRVAPQLIRRQASHFVELKERGIELILGCNGWLWVGLLNKAAKPTPAYAPSFDTGQGGDAADFVAEPGQWEMASRFASAATALSTVGLPIYRETLVEFVQHCIDNNRSVVDMLSMDALAAAVSIEEARRGSAQSDAMES